MARERGRNYPRLSLPKAIKYARMIHDEEGRAPASREVLAVAMGYKGLSGASMKVLGALNQFDLLEGRGDDLKLSDDAVTIIDAPADHPDRKEALYRTAFCPELFSEVKETYGENLPSDANLQYFLVKKGLPSKSARIAVKALRETIDFVDREGGLQLSTISDEFGDEGVDEVDELDVEVEPIKQQRNEKRESDIAGTKKPTDIIAALRGDFGHSIAGAEEFKTRVGPETTARVYFDGPVTQLAIQKLIDYLEFSKDMYPLDAEDDD